jgi:hypothetical protein
MPTPQIGQLYTPTGAEEITQDFLDDLYLAAVANGNAAPPTQPGTDWYALGVAFGNGMLIQYANQRIAEDNSDILTAQGQALEGKRIEYGLPEVKPSPSTGKIRVRVNGSSTIPNGRQFTLPNGLRAMASGTQPVVDKSEIDVIAIDTGTATNAKGGTKVKFISPPLNVSEEAEVSTFFPLTGGVDDESDARKRQRLLNRLRYQPGGGNWAGLRDTATGALASIQDAFVYPALGGPSSAKVVLTKAYDLDNLDFSRAPNTAQVSYVRAAVQAANAPENERVVQAAADEDCNVTLLITIPDSSLSGGNGSGWSDSAPWPLLHPGGTDAGKVTITEVTDATNIKVSAATVASPVVGQTRIAWWSRVDRQFRTYSVIAVSGPAGARRLTVDRPMADSSGGSPQAGDYISPAAERLADYGAAWLNAMGELGPGENTADVNRLPRALRRPYLSVGPGSSLSFPMLKQMSARFSEITSLSYGYANLYSPTVPASVQSPPNVLRLVHFGIYKAQ